MGIREEALVAWIIKSIGATAGDINEKFHVRMKIQKIAYLLKEKGLPLTYSFDLYIRGPYSKSLADDYMTLAKEGDEYIDMMAVKAEVPEEYHRTMDALKTSDVIVLEAASTLRMLLTSSYRGDLEGAIEHLKWIKPDIPNKDIEKAIKLLSSLGMLNEQG